MDYNFTDLFKAYNYIGFESGIFCAYPNFLSQNILIPGSYKDCKYLENYSPRDGQAFPDGYDPRCRGWYQIQRNNPSYTTYTDIYLFATGDLGITNCVPLQNNDLNKYYGALCFDLFPASENNTFLQSYFSSQFDNSFNYLVFSEDT